MDATRGIMDDLQHVDAQSTWQLHHYAKGAHNHAAGTWVPNDEALLKMEGCVRRASAQRQVSSTRQIQTRLEAIQKDSMNVQDLVLEVSGAYPISEDDQLREMRDNTPFGPTYFIVSIDNVTFGSRKRLGCRLVK